MLVPVRILFLISAYSVFHLSDRNWYILLYIHNADNVYILKDWLFIIFYTLTSNRQEITISRYDTNILFFILQPGGTAIWNSVYRSIPVLPQHSLSWLEIDILNVIRWHSIVVNRFGFYLIIKILSKLDIIVPN
jgi:hypothetical protein